MECSDYLQLLCQLLLKCAFFLRYILLNARIEFQDSEVEAHTPFVHKKKCMEIEKFIWTINITLWGVNNLPLPILKRGKQAVSALWPIYGPGWKYYSYFLPFVCNLSRLVQRLPV